MVEGGKLTIENGTLTATGSGSDGMYGVYILANGTAIFGTSDGSGPSITSHFAAIGENHMTAPANVTVYGGTYTANAVPTNNEWWSYFCAPVYAAGSGEINILGGTFNGYYAISDRYADVEQTLNISGGTFNGSSGIDIFVDEVNGSNSTAERSIAAYTNTLDVPAGYEWVGNETDGYELVAIEYVAQVGETQYRTLAEAIEAVTSTNTTVTLLDDVKLDEGIEVANTVILDLDGHEISSDQPFLFTVTGDLTITGNGKITGPA